MASYCSWTIGRISIWKCVSWIVRENLDRRTSFVIKYLGSREECLSQYWSGTSLLRLILHCEGAIDLLSYLQDSCYGFLSIGALVTDVVKSVPIRSDLIDSNSKWCYRVCTNVIWNWWRKSSFTIRSQNNTSSYWAFIISIVLKYLITWVKTLSLYGWIIFKLNRRCGFVLFKSTDAVLLVHVSICSIRIKRCIGFRGSS